MRSDGNAGLRYAGKVGTGFSSRTLSELYPLLRPLERKTSALVDAPGKTSIDNTASVSADVIDINAANNSATVTVSVGAGGGKSK